MKTKTIIGWTLLLIISIIPIFLWLSFGPGTVDLQGYDHLTHSLGELFGLVGMTMFALTFVLSTRIDFIEDIFGGLDKVYIAHAILGGTALVLILFHPIFLVLKFIPGAIDRAATYLLPSSYWSVNFGIIALLGMILLLIITLFTKMKYHRWKFTHEFLGLMFFLAVLHIILVRNTISQDNIFDGYYWYAGIVSIIGLAAFGYSLFIKGRILKNAVYKIRNLKRKGDFFEITMSPEHKPMAYKSGQFIFLRFYNKKLSSESHPFSIASKSNSPDIKIVVKRLGDYTAQLENLAIGDKVSVEGPYGRFNYTPKYGYDQVWIAAGIGITPFLGMVQDLDHETMKKSKVYLFYSAREDTDFVGYDLLEQVASAYKQFKFIPWNTRKQGYITIDAIRKETGPFRYKEFFLCGPPSFKEAIIINLKKQRVSDEDIHEEAFDFR